MAKDYAAVCQVDWVEYLRHLLPCAVPSVVLRKPPSQSNTGRWSLLDEQPASFPRSRHDMQWYQLRASSRPQDMHRSGADSLRNWLFATVLSMQSSQKSEDWSTISQSATYLSTHPEFLLAFGRDTTPTSDITEHNPEASDKTHQ
jgi:hypothetical protein